MISFYFALNCEEQSYKLSYSHTLGKARFCNVGLFDIYVMIMTEFRFGARRTTVIHLTLWCRAGKKANCVPDQKMRAKNDPDLFTIHVCRLHATTMRVS